MPGTRISTRIFIKKQKYSRIFPLPKIVLGTRDRTGNWACSLQVLVSVPRTIVSEQEVQYLGTSWFYGDLKTLKAFFFPDGVAVPSAWLWLVRSSSTASHSLTTGGPGKSVSFPELLLRCGENRSVPRQELWAVTRISLNEVRRSRGSRLRPLLCVFILIHNAVPDQSTSGRRLKCNTKMNQHQKPNDLSL